MEDRNVFHVLEVTRENAPTFAKQGSWFRYVIGNNHTRVVGGCYGTKEKVTQHAEDIVTQHNQRALLGYTYQAPRGRKKSKEV